jgi:hypothetical protein
LGDAALSQHHKGGLPNETHDYRPGYQCLGQPDSGMQRP